MFFRGSTQVCRKLTIYFSIIQRKVLTPNDFHDLSALAERLLNFQYHWEILGQPFQWTFTRRDLARLLAKFQASAAA